MSGPVDLLRRARPCASSSCTAAPTSSGSEARALVDLRPRAPAVGEADLAARDLEAPGPSRPSIRRCRARPPAARRSPGPSRRSPSRAWPSCPAKTSSVMRVRADGRDRVGGDAVAAELGGLHQGERGDAGLGRRVGALADAALEAGAGAGVDDARIDGLARLRLRCASARRRGARGRSDPSGARARRRPTPLRCRRRTCGRARSPRCSPRRRGARSARGSASPARGSGPSRRRRRRSTIASPPASRISVDDLVRPAPRCRRSRRAATPRSLTTTLAPWRANSSAWARPRPRAAPVTITTRPSQIPAMPRAAR